jgi:predicted GIY-YIG superfamily endonuclease
MQEREAALYRYFDKNDRLLYVGVSKSASARLTQHIGVSHWAYQITRVNIEKHLNRAAARAAELQAIKMKTRCTKSKVAATECLRDARRADSTLEDLKRDWADSQDLFDCHCRL